MTDADALFLSQRRFLQALAVSFVGHILVLSFFPGLRPTASRAMEPPPLEVRLSQPPPRDISVPALTSPVKPPPAAEEPPSRPIRHATAPVLAAPHKVESSPEQAAPAVEPQPLARVEPAPASPPIAVPDTIPPEHAAAPEPSAAQEAQREGVLGGFVRQLERALEANLQYPRVAHLRGWQGLVKMRVQFLPGGQLGQISILRSSGFSLLDQTALNMVRTADLPRAPDLLRQREFTVDVPVMFRLRS